MNNTQYRTTWDGRERVSWLHCSKIDLACQHASQIMERISVRPKAKLVMARNGWMIQNLVVAKETLAVTMVMGILLR
jgi:hypothetical protein